MEKVIFYVFSCFALLSSLMVVVSKHPVRSVLFLVLTFFLTAILWILLEAEFLAITLILVYVGAVLVLFLFVIMMLEVEAVALREGFVRFLPLGISVATLMIISLVYAVGPHYFGSESYPIPSLHPKGYSNIQALGELLYTHYLYPFELAGILLLVAIISAIGLTYRESRQRKITYPDRQAKVRKEERIRLVKLESGKENT